MTYETMNSIKGNDKVKFAVFDIETRNWIYPYALSFYDGNIYKVFKGVNCITDFIKFIVRHKYRGYNIYAHNGGKFDFNFLLNELRGFDFPFKIIAQSGRIVELKVYQNNDELKKLKSWNNVKFVDSYMLLPYSLDKLTKDFNVKHKKLNFMGNLKDKRDYEYLYELYKKKDKRFDNYIMNDCYGLYEVLIKFHEIIYNRGGNVGLTLASTSLKTFKKSYLNTGIKMAKRSVNDEMRLAYYGGRTEIFKQFVNGKKYYWYDINSLYPFVMFNHKYPISPPKTILNPTKETIFEHMGITKCKVKAPKNIEIPLLPYRHNKLFFPIGEFEGYWDNCLLVKAYELGYKITPLKAFVFDSDYIFKDYINTFYKLKKQSKSKTAPYIIAKLLMNSLYGKFGQNQDSEQIIKIKGDVSDYEVTDIIDIDYGLYKVKSESKGNHFIPQISIHVTALAQLYLYEFFELILKNGHEVFYCDTDSIATDYGKLKCGKDLGQWKLEHKFTKGYFLLPKTYWIKLLDEKENKIRAKGYISSFQKNLNEKCFRLALFDKNYKGFEMVSDEKILPFKSSFKRHGSFVSKDVVKKSIKTLYDKRKVLKDWSTKPYTVKEIMDMS